MDNLEPVAQSVCQRSESVLEAETEVEDRVAARVVCRALEVLVACWSWQCEMPHETGKTWAWAASTLAKDVR